jgi:hypothetical protein
MDRINFPFRTKLPAAKLNTLQTRVEAEDRRIAKYVAGVGIAEGFTITMGQNASIAAGAGYDELGRSVRSSTAIVVSLANVARPGATTEKYISFVAAFAVVESGQVVNGNNETVPEEYLESGTIAIVEGAVAATGAAQRPTIETGILLGDVLVDPATAWADLVIDTTRVRKITPPAAGWATALAAVLGLGWDEALSANVSDLAAALKAGKGWRPLGDVYFQGPHDAAPSELFYGTWADASYEEANLTRRCVGNLAGSFFGGTPARLSVSVSSGVPSINIVSGGSGYLSGGSGNIPLIIAGGCTTQMVANATVTNGALTAINVTTAGAGYTSGAVAVYDGVVGHGDLIEYHEHTYTAAYAAQGHGSSTPTVAQVASGATSDIVSHSGYGDARAGAETSGAWLSIKKWRRTA